MVTNARAFTPASTAKEATAQVSTWLASPSLALLHEGAGHWAALQRLVTAARGVGGQVQDARIAVICIENGGRELWSADRDCNRFPELTVRNPLIG